MSYMLLVLQQPGDVVQGADGRDRYDRMMDFATDLAARGVLVSGESLGSDLTAVRVRKRGGRATAVDGPFAEAKEMVGGYFLIEAASLEDAVDVAARWPSARIGAIEVRPIEEELPVDRRYA